MDDDTMAEKRYEDDHGGRRVYVCGVAWTDIPQTHLDCAR